MTEQEEQNTIALGIKVSPMWNEQLKAVASLYGFDSVYSLGQALLAMVIPLSRGWHPMSDRVENELAAIAQTALVDGDTSTLFKQLLTIRRNMGMAVVDAKDKRIETIILIERGGVTTTVEHPHMLAECTHSIDEATERLLCDTDSDLAATLEALSPYYPDISTKRQLIRTILHEALTDCQDKATGSTVGAYAQNEYGNVPKQKRNRYVE